MRAEVFASRHDPRVMDHSGSGCALEGDRGFRTLGLKVQMTSLRKYPQAQVATFFTGARKPEDFSVPLHVPPSSAAATLRSHLPPQAGEDRNSGVFPAWRRESSVFQVKPFSIDLPETRSIYVPESWRRLHFGRSSAAT